MKEPTEPNVRVAGRRIGGSNADFERAALLCLMNEQSKGAFADGALLHLLCEAVRLCREYSDHAGAAETKALVDGLRAERDAAEFRLKAAKSALESIRDGMFPASLIATENPGGMRDWLQGTARDALSGLNAPDFSPPPEHADAPEHL